MGAPVVLNIYDLTPQNGWTYWCGVGIFHAGVEIYGEEYAYGGHEYDASGVFATRPRDAPGPVKFRESVPMGMTNLSQSEVQQVVRQLGEEYKGNRYHLLQRNCNHFANDLCIQLVGKTAPGWINRLAGIAVALHCLLPPSWVPPLETPSVAPEGKYLYQDGHERPLITGTRSDVYAVHSPAPPSSSSMHLTRI